MKVLQINANYGFGSTGLIVKDIGDVLQESGHEAYFAYQSTNQKIQTGYKVGNVLDWKIHAIMCRIFGKQGYYSKIATRRLLNYISQLVPDIVHLHNLHSNYVNLNMLLKYLADKDIPTVITMHDCWYFTGKCFHYADSDCDRFQYGCGKCKKKKSPPKSWMFDCSAKVWKDRKYFLHLIPRLKVIGCSNWICNEAKKSFLKDCDISCIYNGVDISIFRERETGLSSQLKEQDEILVMGMANKWFLPENISMITKVHSLENVKLMIVGCSEEQISTLSDMDENIIAIGYVKDRNELAEYYNAADVFVNLTHADTLPTVNMESICCGTPVITYDSCGSPELIDENSGMVIKEFNEEGVVNAILKMKKQKFEECSGIGIKKFDKNQCYEKYVSVYTKLQKTCENMEGKER